MSSTSYYRSPFGDTTYTKVFVGGLAWETQTEEMRRYFEQFGEILEAVIISDKTTAKSKGYGFVTFREAESATRAVADPNPVIDGRKANCNIASFGRPRPSPPRGRGQGGGNSQYQAGAQSGYAGVAAPPHSAAAAQLMYQQYGFTYNPEYGYHQALYNAQLQQAHYYQQQQMYGGVISPSPSSSSLSSTIMPSPYYYGPRPYPHHHHQHQRLPSSLSPSASSYLVYPTNFENSSFAPPPNRPLISNSTELQEAVEEVREGGEMEAPESTSREMTSSPRSN